MQNTECPMDVCQGGFICVWSDSQMMPPRLLVCQIGSFDFLFSI